MSTHNNNQDFFGSEGGFFDMNTLELFSWTGIDFVDVSLPAADQLPTTQLLETLQMPETQQLPNLKRQLSETQKPQVKQQPRVSKKPRMSLRPRKSRQPRMPHQLPAETELPLMLQHPLVLQHQLVSVSPPGVSVEIIEQPANKFRFRYASELQSISKHNSPRVFSASW